MIAVDMKMISDMEMEPFTAVEPYYEPTDYLRTKNWFFCEMNRDDHGFLSGLLKSRRPKKILEIGVANGGTTLLIMNTLQMLGIEAEMISVDLNELWYRDRHKETGFIFKENVQVSLGEHRFLLGHCIAKQIEEIGKGIDFAIIDTTHSMPGELLDFLTIYPYLTKDATVVFHDVNLNIANLRKNSSKQVVKSSSLFIATKALFSVVGGKKFFDVSSDEKKGLPNIAAVQIDERTRASVPSLFFATQYTWTYTVSEEMLSEYRNIFSKHYNKKCLELFDTAVKYNGIALKICPSLFPKNQEAKIDRIKEYLRTARIDIKNHGSEKNDLLILSDNDCKIEKPQWYARDKQGSGYVLECGSGHLHVKIRCVNAGKLHIRLLGTDKRDVNGKRLQFWVDYTKLTVDGKEIFSGLIPAWHDKAYEGLLRDVNDGEILEVEVDWQAHAYTNEELLDLVSMYISE